MGFENIIRPFGPLDVTYPRRIVKVDATPAANVVLNIGGSGSAKTLAYSRSFSLTTYMKKVQKEVKAPQNQAGGADPYPYDPGTMPGQAVPVGGLPR